MPDKEPLSEPEYCPKCGVVQPTEVVRFVDCTLFKCARCSARLDWIFEEEEDYEPEGFSDVTQTRP